MAWHEDDHKSCNIKRMGILGLQMFDFMAWKPRLDLSLVLTFLVNLAIICNCQPQNIETFFPIQTPAPASTISKTSSSSNSKIAAAVAATAAGTLVVSGLLFFLIRTCLKKRRREEIAASAPHTDVFERIDGNVRGLIVDENGLDVIYWRKLQANNNSLQKDVIPTHQSKHQEPNHPTTNSESIQEIPLLRGHSSASHVTILSEDELESNSSTRTSMSTTTPPAIPKEKIPPAPPPPPPMAGAFKSSSKPPPAPVAVAVADNDKVKLKPLHWDKVNANADHSMVWDKMDRGSFRVDQDLMEALFGFVATSRRSPKGQNNPSTTPSHAPSSSKTFILESRKSQNIAIVLKSLAVSREEIVDALNEGQGLNADTIEKLARVAPTQEEQSDILEYKGDPTTLAVAECFLYHILKAVPSAFKRFNAMLFRFNYDSEILEIKESLNTLELGCKELRNRGLFVKLLEAVLKAGNRMNAGTSRGNAQAFNLTSLRKLSDVKSTDGETTLLHFVVEEVVRSEGRRCVLNLIKIRESENSVSDEDREKEYLTLGLPFVGGISAEFSNVKKAALIDYTSLVGSISALSTRMAQVQDLVSQCRGGNFVKEMERFLRNAEEELRSVRNEETRIMQLVKRTTEYYQGGTSKDAPQNLQIFVIVKDFLRMVDQACIDIARTMQKRKVAKASSG
ncbi:formin-like protein 4 [Senna tora]|uniref:Formin-like protein n=1 Tax=Senna tora TaxID=362788 RepID=A0A834WN12_9FABA|nr:formin-like protein 4 [Senna tora]